MKNNKTNFLLMLAFYLLMVNSYAIASSPNCNALLLDAPYVQEQLTTHKWTLREIVQTKNDTAVNLTLFMLPCEKDNILDYNEDGTYLITEGEKMCKTSDDKVKGKGVWEYEEGEKELVDSYMGGRRIHKKILELTPGMLKVEFEGEGNKITTLTYFSEIGLEDDSLTELIDDNSNHAKNITQIPREVMLESRRYILIGQKDFEQGTPLQIDNKGGLMKKVIIYPFLNSTDPTMTVLENERNTALMAQAKKVGIDYIVTGNIIKADSDVDSQGKYSGHVKYSVSLMDVSKEEVLGQEIFEYPQPQKEKKSRNIGKIVNVIGSVAVLRNLRYGYGFGYGGWRANYWNWYYNNYFRSGAANIATDNLGAAFSDASKEERTQYYQSSLAVMDAISNTSGDLGDYIIEKIPITIPINEVENSGKGKFKNLVIEAGSNINIREGEKMKIVRIKESTLSDGTKVSSTTIIANLKVESVNGTRLSTCKPTKSMDKKKIGKALSKDPEEIFVQTMEIPKEKDN